MGPLFNFLIIDPMINSLALLYMVFFDQFWLAIIVFTIITRLGTLPLTIRQTKQMKAMSVLNPRIQAIKERYKDDRGRVSQETMKLFKEAGVNPLGCLGPMVVQLPIFIGLFQALRKTLPANPDALIGLSDRFYSWLPVVDGTVPLNTQFLWMNLAIPDPSPLIMPILVGVTTWAQQKMTTPAATDERQAAQNRMMLWMMPLMLGFFTLQFPSGLALYWTVSNLAGIGIQYRALGGWGPLFTRSTPVKATVQSQPSEAESKESINDGNARSEREDSRGGYRGRPARTRRKPRRSRGRNINPR